ncbi:RNA pseudourine synthase 4 mitochondrial-like, partial [Trifolium pratense]
MSVRPILRLSWNRCRQYCQFSSPEDSKWLTLPPVSMTTTVVNGNQLTSSTSTTALKWVIRCCPQLPKTLIHKLFRLKQVRMLPSLLLSQQQQQEEDNHHNHKFKRVTPKDTLNSGDRIFLPHSVKQITPPESLAPKHDSPLTLTAKQINFIRTLVIYKDPHILVLNKPPGMPVQGGINIKRSLDAVAAECLNYHYSEPPRLVHRLDRDCSGILVMGRTKTTTTLLHSIFRDKTSRASDDVKSYKEGIGHWSSDVLGVQGGWLLLHWVVVDNGKSDRITIVDNSTSLSPQHAITEYRVIGSSSHG